MKDRISRKDIALPDDLPLPISLSGDAAAEDLIAQNQDLIARLAIALRRNSDVSKNISYLENTIKNLKEQNSYISDASLSNRERLDAKDKELKHWKDKLRQQEIDYALLYERYNKKGENLMQRIDVLEKQLRNFEKYRKSINERIRPYINELYSQIGLLKAQMQENEQNTLALVRSKREQYDYMHTKILELTASLADQKIAYETRLQHMEEILAQEAQNYRTAKENLSDVQRKYQIMKELDDEYTLARNRNIVLERERFETESKFEEEVRRLQQEIADLRQENRALKRQTATEFESDGSYSFIEY